MPVLDLLCRICTEIFNDVDDIYSTSCGHVFHLWCLREWQNRSTSCPQCHQNSPTTHKLYLSFDESYETFTEIQNKLKASDNEVETLKTKLFIINIESVQYRVESEKEIADLKKLIANLKDRILRFEGSALKQRQQIVKLTQDISSIGVDSETTIAELQKENEKLKKDLENMAIELAIEVSTKVPSSEETMQKQSQLSELCPTTSRNTISDGPNEMMVQKLHVVSEDFERETTKNTKHVTDKINCIKEIKNQVSILENIENVEKLPNSGDIQEQLPKNTLSTGKVIKRVTSSSDSPNAQQETYIETELMSVLYSDYLDSQQIHEPSVNSIVIQNYPLEKLIYPLENTVLLLANNMDIALKIQDIEKVFVMGLNQAIPLFIRFKTKGIKEKFLAVKSRVSTFHVGMTIKGYVDEESINVFLYAKNKLLYNGFEDICWVNNKILAKKYKLDNSSKRIYTCQHVDNILRNLMFQRQK